MATQDTTGFRSTPDSAANRPANPWDVLVRLFESGINCGINTDVHHHVRVWIDSPKIAQADFVATELDQVAAWMDHEARRLHPKSLYATGRPGHYSPDKNGMG